MSAAFTAPHRAAIFCLLAAAVPAAEAIDFAALERTIADRNVRSIEELLPLLPTDLRSRYVLMFRSRSLHGSSFAHPRAILFDPEARFVISFNGDASQAGFDALETMEFVDSEKSFRFREIVFPESGHGSGAVQISQPNPPVCRKCHGEPPRPIWDTHPSWPGAYGERYDAELTAAETDGLRQFLSEQPGHPRYRYLLGAEHFGDAETFRPSARVRYEGGERPPPNSELGAALGRLNFEAIVQRMESSPRFETHKYLLLATLGGDCGRLDSFFPPDQRSGIEASLQGFVAESGRANAIQAQTKLLRAIGAGASERGGYAQADGVESLDRFRFVAETRLELPTDQWTTALEKGSYDFAWSPSAASEMALYLRKQIARTDPRIRELAEFRTFSARDPYCRYLQQRSRDALASAARDAVAAVSGMRAANARGVESPVQPLPRAQALLAQCASCHLGGVGPHLPFDRPSELAALLRQGHFAHGTLMDEIRWRLAPQAGASRMPLGANIDETDRMALLDYFSALSRRDAAH